MVKGLVKSLLISAQGINDDILQLLPGNDEGTIKQTSSVYDSNQNEIYTKLLGISERIADSYKQILADMNDVNRISWAGTAHEIRQTLSSLLQLLAPDEEIIKQTWYKQEPNTSGPTQKQRVRYILLQYNAGSKVREVAENASSVSELVESLTRATYSRASDAAHKFREKQEVERILRYFSALLYDILNL
jgi:hypothetical protein